MRYGTYPTELKLARVVPIFKSGNSSMPSNYRPISTLSIFNKLFEKILSSRLNEFLFENNIVTPHQFGFTAGRNTTLAIFYFINDVLKAFNSRQFTIALFLDLRKAFDTVNHEILIKKLDCYGIRGPFNKLVRSYLSSRKQYVILNGERSEILNVNTGVPQGSVLGPLLFNVFINDIADLDFNVKCKLYADDAVFYISCDNYDTACNSMQIFLNSLTDWLGSNKLLAHEGKTKLMCFTNRTFDNKDIFFNGVQLEWVESFKYLGFIIDRRLSFNEAISDICMKLNRVRGILFVTSKYFNINTRMCLFYSLAYQILIQNIIIWGGAAPIHVNRVKVVLNHILRTVLMMRVRDIHTHDLYRILNVLPFEYIYKLFLLKFYYRAAFYDENLFNSVFRPLIPGHLYETRNVRFLAPPIRLDIEKYFTVYNCIKLLNEIPERFLISTPIGSFKRDFKLYANQILYPDYN